MKTLAVLLAVAGLVFLTSCAQTAQHVVDEDHMCEFHQKAPDMNRVLYALTGACGKGDLVACEMLTEMNDAD
jgi:hypothetical protein